MKYLYTFLIFVYFAFQINSQATLSITDKSVIVKTIPNQNQVANPQKGSVIYNEKTNNPNFFDGKNWREMAGTALASTNDSITYKVNLNTGTYQFSTTEKPLISISFNSDRTVSIGGPGVIGAGPMTFDAIITNKVFDMNTIFFKRAYFGGVKIPTVDFFMYQQGATTPYFRITLTNVILTNNKVVNSNDNNFSESLSFSFSRIKFTDVAANVYTEYDLATGSITNN